MEEHFKMMVIGAFGVTWGKMAIEGDDPIVGMIFYALGGFMFALGIFNMFTK